MGAIDIGLVAEDRAGVSFIHNATYVNKTNPANDTGILTDGEIWIRGVDADGVDVWVGTFSAAGNVLTCRDSESIGAVTKGSKQTFSGMDIDVEAGDYFGAFDKSGTDTGLETDTAGHSGIWFFNGDVIDPTDSQTFTFLDNFGLSLFGTGTTPGWAGGDVSGVAIAAIAKINGVALADITKVNGVA